MTVLRKLASALNRRDEIPNQELADAIAASNNTNAVKELINNLGNKNKDIQQDYIKVLYEAGAKKPELIAGYAKTFIALLNSKNNRLQWGAMTALGCIVSVEPAVIYKALPAISLAAQSGSVITKDQYVAILIKLSTKPKYKEDALILLNESLLQALPNQLPMYAEQALLVITGTQKSIFIKTLEARLKDVEKESKRKRIETVLKKMQR